jgi:hypothetical protein
MALFLAPPGKYFAGRVDDSGSNAMGAQVCRFTRNAALLGENTDDRRLSPRWMSLGFLVALIPNEGGAIE